MKDKIIKILLKYSTELEILSSSDFDIVAKEIIILFAITDKNDSIFSNKRAKYCKDNELWKSCLYWRKKHRCIKACDYHKIDEEIFEFFNPEV